jgi:hypothetical protein
MKKSIQSKIEKKLNRAAKLMDEAVKLARENGHPNAEGFASGEGDRLQLNVMLDDTLERQSSEWQDRKVRGDVRAMLWDCGAW